MNAFSDNDSRGQVIEDEDATPVRGHQQIALARMDGQVAHGHIGNPRLDLGPLLPAIERTEQSPLGAHEQ